MIVRLRRKVGENVRGRETISGIEIVFIVDLFFKSSNAIVLKCINPLP